MFRQIGFLVALMLFAQFGFDASIASPVDGGEIFTPRGVTQKATPHRTIGSTEDSVIVVPTGHP